jgi:hypothetical protein
LIFLGFQGTKEEKARAFAAQARADSVYAFNSVLKFFQSKRADAIELSKTIFVNTMLVCRVLDIITALVYHSAYRCLSLLITSKDLNSFASG